MTDEPESTAVVPRKALVQSGAEVGAFVPSSLDEVFRIAQAMSLSGLAPQSLNTPEKITVAILAGAELGLPPFQSVQSFAVINSRPTIWGDGMLAVIRSRGIRVREWTEGEDDGRVAHCEITRPDTGEIIERKFSVSDAKKAGLWGKQGPWQQYPGRMLQMRSRAFACRDGAADILRGFQMREEVEDYGATAAPAGADGLKARLEAQKASGEGYNAHVERVLDHIEPVQQERPRRTRRTRPQIELDEKVSALFDGGASDVDDIAAQAGASLADVVESLQRLGITSIIPDDGERPTAEASMDQEGGEADTSGTNDRQSTDTTQPPAVEVQPDLLGESAPAAEPPAEPEQAAVPASDAGTAAEAGTDGTGEPISLDLTTPAIIDPAQGHEPPMMDPLSAEEAEVDEGEFHPTSAASPGPANLYRMALANAGDFASVRGIVTEFRKTTAFGDMDASERIEVNRAAVERLNDPSVIGVPGVDQNVWLFSLWMATADNEQVAQQFEALKQSGDWQSIPPERQAIIASAVHERTGSML